MSSIKQVKSYLVYLNKFKEISKSVQFIAIAKLRKLRARIEARECALAFAVELFSECESTGSDCLAQTIVVITSDKSCSGKLNSDVLAASREIIDSYLEQNNSVHIITIGKKGYKSLALTYKSNMCKRVSNVCAASFFLSYVITLCIFDTSFDKCTIIFSKYYKIFEQVASFYEFKSYSILFGYIYATRKSNFFFDLLLANRIVSLSRLYTYHICIVVLDAFEETRYSELGCRASSMELANRNATKLIQANILVYNKLRQADITTSLLEVVAGAIYSK